MTAILHLGILFLAKILDNALGTSKTILIQHGRSILAGATLAVSNYIGYRITKQIVTADSNMAMIAVSVASGFGCCLAMAINKKLSKDRLYVNILMSDNKEAMQDLRAMAKLEELAGREEVLPQVPRSSCPGCRRKRPEGRKQR